jgi:hypothetical protein
MRDSAADVGEVAMAHAPVPSRAVGVSHEPMHGPQAFQGLVAGSSALSRSVIGFGLRGPAARICRNCVQDAPGKRATS